MKEMFLDNRDKKSVNIWGWWSESRLLQEAMEEGENGRTVLVQVWKSIIGEPLYVVVCNLLFLAQYTYCVLLHNSIPWHLTFTLLLTECVYMYGGDCQRLTPRPIVCLLDRFQTDCLGR